LGRVAQHIYARLLRTIEQLGWTSHGIDGTADPQNEARSNASGLTPREVLVIAISIQAQSAMAGRYRDT
jgi:hypothetical protein